MRDKGWAKSDLSESRFQGEIVPWAELTKEGRCPEETVPRQINYLSDNIENDHGKLRQLIGSGDFIWPRRRTATRASQTTPGALCSLNAEFI
jgi:hypothetical protein